MIVCSCEAVTARTVEAAVASGATNLADVAARCGAGIRCGGCWPELERLLGTKVEVGKSHRHAAA